MTGNLLPRAASTNWRIYSTAIQLSSPQELRKRLMLSRIGSGLSPQNNQLTSITSNAGRLPKPPTAPKPPAAKTALSRSVRNLSQTYSVIAVTSILGCAVTSDRQLACHPPTRRFEFLATRADGEIASISGDGFQIAAFVVGSMVRVHRDRHAPTWRR